MPIIFNDQTENAPAIINRGNHDAYDSNSDSDSDSDDNDEDQGAPGAPAGEEKEQVKEEQE